MNLQTRKSTIIIQVSTDSYQYFIKIKAPNVFTPKPIEKISADIERRLEPTKSLDILKHPRI